jgi:hypothetical protein
MLMWAWCSSHKKCVWAHYAKLLFLHPVGSVGHVVHFAASGPQNVIALFLMLRWDRCGFDKNHAGTSYAELEFLHLVGSAGHVVNSNASGA